MSMIWQAHRLRAARWVPAFLSLAGAAGCAGAPYSDPAGVLEDAAWRHPTGDDSGTGGFDGEGISGDGAPAEASSDDASTQETSPIDASGDASTDAPTNAEAGDAGGSQDAGSGASIAVVQAADATISGAAPTIKLSFAKAQSAGDLVVVAVGWNDATSAVTQVSDSRGNVYVLAVGPTRKPPNLTQSIYYAKGVASAAAGANTLAVAFDASANAIDVRAVEYSGLSTSAPLDAVAASSGSGTSASSGSATTTTGRELVFGAGMCTDLYSGPGSQFQLRLLTPAGDLVEDRFVASTGSYSASAPISASADWVMQMATFR
jgi:hypothetical protein